MMPASEETENTNCLTKYLGNHQNISHTVDVETAWLHIDKDLSDNLWASRLNAEWHYYCQTGFNWSHLKVSFDQYVIISEVAPKPNDPWSGPYMLLIYISNIPEAVYRIVNKWSNRKKVDSEDRGVNQSHWLQYELGLYSLAPWFHTKTNLTAVN